MSLSMPIHMRLCLCVIYLRSFVVACCFSIFVGSLFACVSPFLILRLVLLLRSSVYWNFFSFSFFLIEMKRNEMKCDCSRSCSHVHRKRGWFLPLEHFKIVYLFCIDFGKIFILLIWILFPIQQTK